MRLAPWQTARHATASLSMPRSASVLLAFVLAGCAAPIKAPTTAQIPAAATPPLEVSHQQNVGATPGRVVVPGSADEASTSPPAAPTPLGDAIVLIAPLDGGEAAFEAGSNRADRALAAGKGKPLAQGMASWYGPRFHGRRTASGERYDMHALTAAHKTLPFGTKLRVRSVHTGKEVVVRINDRGPYKHQRIIDLSRAAMVALGTLERGVTEVELLRD